MNIFKKKLKNNRGFTLIEIVLAVSLFSVLALTAGNVLQVAVKSQRSIANSQSIQENMLYVVEAMSKEVRMAKLDTDGNCGDSERVYSGVIDDDELHFINQYDECVSYYLEDEGGLGRLMIERLTGSDNRTYSQPARVTPDNIDVRSLKFFIVDGDENKQPRVTVSMTVVAIGVGEMSQQLQFTVSSRSYQ